MAALLRERWQADRDSVPIAVQSLVPLAPTESFWSCHYYEAVAAKVAKQGQGTSQNSPGARPTLSPPARRRPDATTAPSAGMGSILRGSARVATLQTPEPAEAPLVGSVDVVAALSPGQYVRYEGTVIDSPDQPRSIQTGGSSLATSALQRLPAVGDLVHKCVLELLLGDNTGPVIVLLWNAAAEDYMRLAAAHPEGIEYIGLTMMRVAPQKESEFNGPSITPTRVLHSSEAKGGRQSTVVSVIATPSSPFLLSKTYVVPSFPLCLTNFRQMEEKLKPPFRVTVRGMIEGAQQLDYTLKGQEKRVFRIVDEAGTCLECNAVGRNAWSNAIVDGNEVVLYHCTGRSSGLWLFTQALIVFTGQKLHHRATTCIALR